MKRLGLRCLVMMLCGNSAFIQCVPNAMLHVILDQGALSQVKDALYSFELLDEVQQDRPPANIVRMLAGRTICWDNGETSAFLPGGKYENSRHGRGTWKVTSTGLEIHSETFGGIFQVEMRDDGTILDATYNVAGKVCK